MFQGRLEKRVKEVSKEVEAKIGSLSREALELHRVSQLERTDGFIIPPYYITVFGQLKLHERPQVYINLKNKAIEYMKEGDTDEGNRHYTAAYYFWKNFIEVSSSKSL